MTTPNILGLGLVLWSIGIITLGCVIWFLPLFLWVPREWTTTKKWFEFIVILIGSVLILVGVVLQIKALQ